MGLTLERVVAERNLVQRTPASRLQEHLLLPEHSRNAD